MTDSLSQGDDRIVQGPGDSGLQATTRAVTDAELTPREALELELVSDGDLDASLAEVMPIRSLRADAWRRFKRNRLAVAGLFIVVVLVGIALIGPLFVPSPLNTNFPSLLHPTAGHWFGTDQVGADVLARVIYGLRVSLFIGVLATAAETIIGIFIGCVAGWFGGWTDVVLMRFVDILLGIPYLVLALVLVAAIGRGINAVIITLAVTAWLQTARIVRAGFLQVRDLEYVDAARCMGIPARRIVWRHILPNVFQPVVVLAAVGVGGAILAEAALSFLGVGVQPPNPSLGLMINDASKAAIMQQAPWLLIFPGLFIVLAVLGFLLIGDGLRDALDVKDT
ncbi:MAG TPA: ABC transporter permease [Acidimicrobiales bacterium]|jgi:ABC-type dipeptide/oligopeptide/nickel transport system permease subunit|nr:ABC transporter permease [Acidimicrobiales bacterium]